MAIEQFGVSNAPASREALSDREFSVSRKGYDRDEVRAFLVEIEDEYKELEAWADQARSRLATAREEMIPRAEVDEAMIAIFDAKERVLDKARRRAERIEADARERARASQREVAAEIVLQAQEEARRIIQVAITGTTPVTETSISDVARREADRVVGEAELIADHWIQGASLVSDPEEANEPPPQIDPEAGGPQAVGKYESRPEPQPAALVVEEHGRSIADEDDGADRPSRYKLRSAGLPSIGAEASKVLGSMESLRITEDDA